MVDALRQRAQRQGIETRLTSDAGSESFPVWSPDGRHLLFTRGAANAVTGGTLLRKLATGAGNEELLLEADNIIPYAWSTDGRFITYLASSQRTLGDLYMLPTFGDRTPRVFLQTKFHELDSRLSPDGHRMVYVSGEPTRSEIYVQSFPPSDQRWRVSRTGGSQPMWRADGKELFYLARDRTLMAVDVRTAPDFAVGLARPLFKIDSVLGPVRSNYVPARDGQRFLVNAYAEGAASTIVVLLNWLPFSPQ